MISTLPSCPLCIKSDDIHSKYGQVRQVSTVAHGGTDTYPPEFWVSGALPPIMSSAVNSEDPAKLLQMPAPPQAET